MKVPCYKCEDRIVGCHSVCERYISYKKEMTKQNELIEKAKHLEHLRRGYEFDRAKRCTAIAKRNKYKKFK